MPQRLLIINIAGLGHQCVGTETPNLSRLANLGGGCVPVQPPVPALTSPSQVTALTGELPSQHGIVANGWYFKELAQVLNWQRSARLISGQPLWETMREIVPDGKSVNLFWRYATHSTCDVNVTERPTYWADGGKGQDIYTEPDTVRDELVERLGPFPLFRFWGPAADITSTKWIADATLHMIAKPEFDLVLTYLPHLDYDHQRFGPQAEQGKLALQQLDEQAGRLIDAALADDMRIAVISDYAFEKVSQPIYLNRFLREAGLIKVQRAENGELLEHGASDAFAVCDQQIAHIYINDKQQLAKIATMVRELDGVERVLDATDMQEMGIYHDRAGDLLAIAEPDCWFTYHYWLDEAAAPDFAPCVAIHAKPGWDPAELFLRPGLGGKLHLAKRILQKMLRIRAPFDVISTDAKSVGGSHGRIPASNEQRAVLLTSWPHELGEDVLPMQQLKPILLQPFQESK